MTTTRTASDATIARREAEEDYALNPTPANLEELQAAGQREMDEYLAGFDARYPADKADDAPLTPYEAPATYADWFQALLDQNAPCTDRDAFERAAYEGHTTYSFSMTDGHYARESFERWVIGFRQDPIGQLYWGNDARHTLAPQANSYASTHITYLPPTPTWDTLAPKAKARRQGGSEPRRNQKRPHRKG